VIIGRIFTLPFESFKYMHFTKTVFSNEEIIISRSGYTAEDGFEIYSSNRLAEKIWDVLFETGSPYGLKPCGLGARDVLRIEAGYPLYGHEINDEINPLQACLGWAVKLNKNFISRDKLLKIKQNGLRRKRVGFTMTERAVPRQGYRVYSSTGEAGYVTSGTYSPNLERFIGMAYIDNGLAKPATPITIEIRDKQYRAETADFNFIRRR
jgi:aminomethyltransferase